MYSEMNAPIGDHVEDSSKLGCLSECACSLTIDGIEKTRDPVRKCAVLRMVVHKMKRQRRKKNACVSWSIPVGVSSERSGVSAGCVPMRLGTKRKTFSE